MNEEPLSGEFQPESQHPPENPEHQQGFDRTPQEQIQPEHQPEQPQPQQDFQPPGESQPQPDLPPQPEPLPQVAAGPTIDSGPAPVVVQPEPEKELYSWKSPSRPFKKRNREFYTTVGALVILLSVILLFAKEFLLIAVILSFGFVSYVLATVAPHDVPHKLTNKGVRTGSKLYLWGQLGRYWWESKWKQEVVHIEAPGQFPGRILMMLGEGDKKKVDDIVNKYLVKEKPEPTWMDRASKWLQEKVPLESG